MKIRYAFIGLLMALASATAAEAAVSVNIGINIPVYPRLVAVPGYPVYYAPGINSNYFFYDGMYWVFEGDAWYASSWYNGPWHGVGAEFVPLSVLRVPVRYYRRPPAFFHGWGRDAAPRWGEHWGRDWESHHAGWDRRDPRERFAASPLPSYQRNYSGSRYPQAERQAELHSQNYRYQPRENFVREHYEQQGIHERGPGPGHDRGRDRDR
jgi:hypothetical protein